MHVLNIHERSLVAPRERVGALLDGLASPDDALWPRRLWPRMALDRPLGVGAAGGHGPIRYVVERYSPGESIHFRFTGPPGFDGWHALEVLRDDAGCSVLRHTLQMDTHGDAIFTWPVVFRHLHDALIEDALTQAESALGLPATRRQWSVWVWMLRWLLPRI